MLVIWFVVFVCSILTSKRMLLARELFIGEFRFINVISALKGALRIVRAIPEAEVYTLWMDPMLNESGYILPGLGDAGDRLNGKDEGTQRNMIQLIADYGSSIVNLYRNQVREIERTVLK